MNTMNAKDSQDTKDSLFLEARKSILEAVKHCGLLRLSIEENGLTEAYVGAAMVHLDRALLEIANAYATENEKEG